MIQRTKYYLIIKLPLFFAVILIFSFSAFAQEIDPQSAQCLKCHAKKSPANLVFLSGKTVNLPIDPEKYSRSVHGEFECTFCHDANFETYPHNSNINDFVLNCSDCHSGVSAINGYDFDKIDEQFFKSIHVHHIEDQFNCGTCHNVHEMNINSSIAVPEKVRLDNAVCLECHGSSERYTELTSKNFAAAADGHEWLPGKELHWRSVRCIECHTPAEETVSHNILSAAKAEKKCEACHSVNSILTTKLYRHKTEKSRREKGFLNSVVLNDAYVIGMTRNILLDRLSIILFFLITLGIAVHGAGRWITRGKKPKEPDQSIQYPLWLRLWHWSNAALFFLLIISGISLHYSGTYSLFLSFSTARTIHNICGIVLSILYLAFIVGNILSGNWRYYVPDIRGILVRLRKQVYYYGWGLFKGDTYPYFTTKKEKFNPLQQITYLGIMYGMMLFLILSGLFLLFPEYAPERILGMGGVLPMAILHLAAGYIALLFMIGHTYLATTGNNVISSIKDMITGGKN